MSHKLASLVAAIVLFGSPAVSSAAETTTSPGKNSAAVSEESAFANPDGSITPLSVTILKAKPKRILKIDATVRLSWSFGMTGTYLTVNVNGNPVSQPSFLQFQCPNSVTYCVGNGSFWVDVDAAGLAKQEVVVTMNAGNSSSFPAEYAASLTAELVKK